MLSDIYIHDQSIDDAHLQSKKDSHLQSCTYSQDDAHLQSKKDSHLQSCTYSQDDTYLQSKSNLKTNMENDRVTNINTIDAEMKPINFFENLVMCNVRNNNCSCLHNIIKLWAYKILLQLNYTVRPIKELELLVHKINKYYKYFTHNPNYICYTYTYKYHKKTNLYVTQIILFFSNNLKKYVFNSYILDKDNSPPYALKELTKQYVSMLALCFLANYKIRYNATIIFDSAKHDKYINTIPIFLKELFLEKKNNITKIKENIINIQMISYLAIKALEILYLPGYNISSGIKYQLNVLCNLVNELLNYTLYNYEIISYISWNENNIWRSKVKINILFIWNPIKFKDEYIGNYSKTKEDAENSAARNALYFIAGVDIK